MLERRKEVKNMDEKNIEKMCRWIQLPILKCKLESHLDDEEKIEEIMKWCRLSSYDSREVVDNVINKVELVGFMEGLEKKVNKDGE